MASQKFMLTNFPHILLMTFFKQQTLQLKQVSAFKIHFIKKKKKFCRLHVEISIFWSGRYLLKRKWLGFNSLHYLYKSKFGFFYWEQHRHPYIRFPKQTTSEKRLTYNSAHKGYHHYISRKDSEYPATNSTALCRRDDIPCYWEQWN